MRALCLLPFLFLCSCAVIQAPSLGDPLPVVRVIDGDTFEIRYGELDVGVRLLCVNTPERGKPGYREAAEFLKEQLSAGEVVLERDPKLRDKDGFGRLLRYVYCRDKLVNAAVVRAGHSVYWTKYGKSSLHEAEFCTKP